MKPVAAAFDFDGTLGAGVSGLRFFRQLLGPAGNAWFWATHLRALARYGRRDRHEASLDIINRSVFAGRRAEDVALAAEEFARDELPRHLLPAGMVRLRDHLARGHRCILVTRGYELYLTPWARALGIRDVLATRLATGADGRLTGAMPEPSCDGEHKRTRLLARLGDRAAWELHAYGDGPGDFALLAEADCAFLRVGEIFRPWKPAAPR